jgi:hypothetical protein
MNPFDLQVPSITAELVKEVPDYLGALSTIQSGVI